MGVIAKLRGRSQAALTAAPASTPASAPVADDDERETEPTCFGPAGPVDEDGYSTPHSYAEKAAGERDLLDSFEARISEAAASGRYNELVALTAYASDLRDRVERFEALARDDRVNPTRLSVSSAER
jgi:hypothetical protein